MNDNFVVRPDDHGTTKKLDSSPSRAHKPLLRRDLNASEPWRAGVLGPDVQVPTRKAPRILRSIATTLCATMRPVLGFSEGMFSMVIVKRAESEST